MIDISIGCLLGLAGLLFLVLLIYAALDSDRNRPDYKLFGPDKR